jgi:hypothetical protein
MRSILVVIVVSFDVGGMNAAKFVSSIATTERLHG